MGSFILILGTFRILTSIFSRIFCYILVRLKKVVAFSTTSQLGLICFSIILINFGLIIFHIIFHAFSKAIIFKSTRLVLHTFNSSQDSRKISNFINFSINSFKIFLILGSFSLIRVFIFICFYSKDTFSILLLFNFGSNLILTLILTYNRKIFNYLLILIFLNFVLSLTLLIFNFNFSLFNSFIRKFLPQIILVLILPKILNFNFSNLSFNIFNISNFSY